MSPHRERPPRRPGVGGLLALALLVGCQPERPPEDGDEGALPLTLENIHRDATGTSGVAISPDGRRLAIVASGPEGRGVYFTASEPDTGSVPRFGWPGGSPAWSPDGSRLAFLREGRLWVGRPEADAGAEERAEPVPVTGPVEGLRAPAWSPDGSTIAFYSSEGGFQDVWLVPADGSSEPARLTRESMAGDDTRFEAAWSPDGSRLALVSNRAGYWRDDVWVVEVPEGGMRRLSDGIMAASTPVWSPDGSAIAAFGTSRDGYWYEDLADLYLLDPAGGGARRVEMEVWASDAGMRNRPFWSDDGETLYFPYQRRGEYALWAVPAAGGVATRITQVGGAMRGFAATPGAELFAFVRSDPTSGPDVWLVEAAGGPARRVTGFAPRWAGLRPPREVSFRTFDGLYIHGFLYLPPEAEEGKRCPALVEVHGGGTNAYLKDRNLTEQYLASRGFVVLAINYRGGSGYGRRFQDLAVEDWLGDQARDPGAAAEYLRSLEFVGGRVGIYGGSYGGMQTMAALTRTPEVFDAGVPMRGIYSESRTFEHQDRVGKIFTMTGHGGTPEERPAAYEVSETLSRLDRIRAPLLIMHGEEDVRAPFLNHRLAVEALERSGAEFEAVSYPGEGHGFRDPANRIDMYRRLEEFFRERLGGCTDA